MPRHWADTYIGRPYVPGQHDCAALAVEVLRDQFGLHVELPADRPHDPAQAARVIAGLQGAHAKAIPGPVEGCAVLLRRGPIARPWHIGIYYQRAGEGHVLHTTRQTSAISTRVRDLARLGYQIEGYYTWI